MLALPDSPIRRRSILLGAAALGALRALPSLGSDRARADIARLTSDPRETLRLYVKLNGDASGKPYYSWFSGHVYAVNQGQLSTPLFGIEGYGMGWAEPRPDGSFMQIWKEVGFYKDLKSDAILETWRNPLNNALCDVMHIHNRSVNYPMVPRGDAFSAPGLQVSLGGDLRHAGEGGAQDFTLPWYVNGDRVATSMDSCVTGTHPLDPKVWRRESSGERYSTTEFVMQYASLRELLDEHTTNVATVAHWTRIVPWLPWMLMGQAPGQCFYRCATRKLAGFNEIPQHLLDYARVHYPDFLRLSTPEEQKLPGESSYEVFKATRKPVPL